MTSHHIYSIYLVEIYAWRTGRSAVALPTVGGKNKQMIEAFSFWVVLSTTLLVLIIISRLGFFVAGFVYALGACIIRWKRGGFSEHS